MTKKIRILFVITLLLSLLTSCSFLDLSSSSQLTGASTTITTKTIPSYIEDTGNISIYFCPREPCEQILLDTLNLAQSSLHCAVYEIDLPSVNTTLRKKSTEIDVKIITDNDYLHQFNTPYTKADRSGLMHDKFCIIDNNITTTGSMNPTINDAHKNNNNLIIIHSKRIAQNYEDEFQEMWNNTFKKGNPTTNPSIKLHNTLLQTYFCPEENCAEKIRTQLKQAKQEIYFMTFSFTNHDIANILLLKNLDNITIRGIMERRQIDKDSTYIILHNNSIPILIDQNKNNLHHKVFLIDNETIITGSFNPTKGGDERNDENILIIKDKTIAKLYLQEFDYLWNLWNNKTITFPIETDDNNTTKNNTDENEEKSTSIEPEPNIVNATNIYK